MANVYLRIFRISIANKFAYFASAMAHSIFVCFVFFVFYLLWGVIYQKGGLADYTFYQILWYLVISEAAVGSSKVAESIEKDVQSGDLVYYLTKPYSYVGFVFASCFAEFLFYSFNWILVGGAVVLLLTKSFAISNPWFLIIYLLAVVISVLIHISINLFAVWLEDARALRWIYQKTVFVLGGMMFPLEIFPPLFQKILKLLPFAYTTYAPARLSVVFSWPEFFNTLLVQLFYVALFLVLLVIIYRKVIKKMTAQGG